MEARDKGQVLYPDQAMSELMESTKRHVHTSTHSPGQQELSFAERKKFVKMWQDIYHIAVDYHFNFYYGLDRGGRPRKDAEFFETEQLKEEGFTNPQLAEKYGVTVSAILKRRRKVKNSVSPPSP